MNRNLYNINVLKLLHSRNLWRATRFTTGISMGSVLLIFFRYRMSVIGFVTRETRRVPHVEQKLSTLPEHLNSPPLLSLGSCTALQITFVCLYSFGHCIVCSSSEFSLPLWNLFFCVLCCFLVLFYFFFFFIFFLFCFVLALFCLCLVQNASRLSILDCHFGFL